MEAHTDFCKQADKYFEKTIFTYPVRSRIPVTGRTFADILRPIVQVLVQAQWRDGPYRGHLARVVSPCPARIGEPAMGGLPLCPHA